MENPVYFLCFVFLCMTGYVKKSVTRVRIKYTFKLMLFLTSPVTVVITYLTLYSTCKSLCASAAVLDTSVWGLICPILRQPPSYNAKWEVRPPKVFLLVGKWPDRGVDTCSHCYRNTWTAERKNRDSIILWAQDLYLHITSCILL